MPVSTPKVFPILFERDVELAAIDEMLNAAMRGDGRLVVITGEAGSGKTRFVSEIEALADARGCGRLSGICLERDRGIPFAGVVDLLGHVEREHPVGEDVADIVGWPAFARRVPGAGGSDRDTVPPVGSPELARRRQLDSIVQVLERLARERPLLVILEDGHWADPSTLELIERLPRRLSGKRILALVTARTDEPHSEWPRCLVALRRSRQVVEVEVEPLSPAGVAGLLGALLGAPVSPSVAAVVSGRSGGNPLFVEELAATVPLRGSATLALSADGGGPVPPTLAELVRQRLDGLSRQARAIADLAAVASGPCTFDLLLVASGLSHADVEGAIRTLIDRFIMVEFRSSGGARVGFRHALTRDAIYDRLIDPERRMLHWAIGGALAMTADASDPTVAADLGRHFHAARDWHQTITYARRAGEAANAAHATAESLVHFQRALDAAIALGHADRGAIHRRCGQALDLLGSFDRAREHGEAALALARERDERGAVVDALDDLARLHASRDYRAAELLAREALARSIELADEARHGRSLNRLGNILTNLGRFGDGRELHEAAHRRFVALGDDRGAAASVDLTAMAWYLAGDISTARVAFGQAADRFATLGDVEGVASARTSRGLYLAVIDGPCATDVPPEEYRRDALAGLKLCREIEWRSGEIYALVALACAALGEGELGFAGDRATAAHALALEVGHEQWTVIASFVLGLRCADLLDYPGAIDRFEQGLTIATRLGSGQWCERLRAWIAQCHVRRGDLDAAGSALPQVVPGDPDRPDSIGQRRVCMVRAERDLREGRLDAAVSWVDRLLDGPAGPRPAEAMLLRGRILAAMGRIADADAALLEARRLGEGVRPRQVLWRVAAERSLLWSEEDRTRAVQEAQRARDALAQLAATITIEAERGAFRSAPEVRRWLAPAGRRRTADSAAPDGLTGRERDVARAVAGGLANKEIARELGIAEKTVEMHVGSCLGKLGFSSRAQLAVWAADQGLLVPTGLVTK